MKTATKLTLGIVALLGCVVLAVLWTAWRQFPERHARACLETVRELADRTLNTSIPQRDCIDAVENAEYIQRYYPVGAVLPETHPFAITYRTEREEQIDRILAGLRTETGADHGTNWSAWKEELVHYQIQATGVPPPPDI